MIRQVLKKTDSSPLVRKFKITNYSLGFLFLFQMNEQYSIQMWNFPKSGFLSKIQNLSIKIRKGKQLDVQLGYTSFCALLKLLFQVLIIYENGEITASAYKFILGAEGIKDYFNTLLPSVWQFYLLKYDQRLSSCSIPFNNSDKYLEIFETYRKFMI